MGKLHYLSHEEEVALKANIPWEDIDEKAQELVRVANSVNGIATVQSCAGHVNLKANGEELHVEGAHIAFRATKERMMQAIFELAPGMGGCDVEIRYFRDASFWLCVGSEPSERWKLLEFFRGLQAVVWRGPCHTGQNEEIIEQPRG